MLKFCNLSSPSLKKSNFNEVTRNVCNHATDHVNFLKVCLLFIQGPSPQKWTIKTFSPNWCDQYVITNWHTFLTLSKSSSVAKLIKFEQNQFIRLLKTWFFLNYKKCTHPPITSVRQAASLPRFLSVFSFPLVPRPRGPSASRHHLHLKSHGVKKQKLHQTIAG